MNNAKTRHQGTSGMDGASNLKGKQSANPADLTSLSVQTMQKLLQNNLEYSQTVFGNMMQFLQPFSSGQQPQDIFAAIVEANKRACEKTQEIISEAAGKFNPLTTAEPGMAPSPVGNFFNWWTSLNPLVEAAEPAAGAATPFAMPGRVVP